MRIPRQYNAATPSAERAIRNRAADAAMTHAMGVVANVGGDLGQFTARRAHFRSAGALSTAFTVLPARESYALAGVVTRAAGYTADMFLDRATGTYDSTETRMGFVALMNDLHKGRDSGRAWSRVID